MATTTWKVDERASTTGQAQSAMIDTKRHIFPFFELPAEVRDLIYDACITDIQGILSATDDASGGEDADISKYSNVKITAHSAAPANLLLVSQRFAREIRARTSRYRVITLTSADLSQHLFSTPFFIPTTLLAAHHIKIIMSMDMYPRPRDLKWFFERIPYLLGVLRQEQKVTVHWNLQKRTRYMIEKSFWERALDTWRQSYHRTGTGKLFEMYIIVRLPPYRQKGERPALLAIKWNSDTGIV